MLASARLASTLALVPVDCYSLFGLDALKRLPGDSCWTVSQTFGTKLARQQTLHTHKTLNTDCLFFFLFITQLAKPHLLTRLTFGYQYHYYYYYYFV